MEVEIGNYCIDWDLVVLEENHFVIDHVCMVPRERLA